MELKYKNWKDVSIKKYYELEEISENSISEGEEKDMEIIACLCESTIDEVSRIPYPEYYELKHQVGWLSRFVFDTKHDLDKLEIKGKKYRVCKDFSKLSTAQYIDFQSFYNKNDLKQYYGNILSTFVIPEEAKEYNTGYDVVEEAKFIYENLDICRANQLMYFFVKRCLLLTKVIAIYSKWLLKRMIKSKKTPEEVKKVIQERLEQIQQKLDSLGYL